MVTLEQIKSNLEDVTSEQIGKAHKIIAFNSGEDFYLIENSKGDTDDNGDVIEYKAQYSHEHGFTCTCKSGQTGFSNVRHSSGVCWHLRAAVACFLEEEAAMQEMIEAEQTAKAEGTLQHPQEMPVVRRIEDSIPAWMLNARPSKGMDKSPREY